MGVLFENKKINTGRQFELDIARGLAVIFMIAVHVLGAFSDDQVQESVFGGIVNFLGSPPAAPVFMFLLGVGIVYSRRSEARILLKRGIIVLFLGYVLNFMRGVLPGLIENMIYGYGYIFESLGEELGAIDILQFAGLTLIFFALVKKVSMNNTALLIIAGIFVIVSTITYGKQVDGSLVSSITGLFWGSSELSFFPFVSWIIYPIGGYVFGTFLIRCSNKSTLYTTLLSAGLVLFVLTSFICIGIFDIDVGLKDDYAYYHHYFAGHMIFISFTALWVSMLFFISKFIGGIAKRALERWSSNVTPIYCIHWVIIGMINIFVDSNTMGIVLTLILIIGITAVSDILAFLYLKIKRGK